MVEWVTIGRAKLALADYRDVLPELPDWTVITDPPYGIGFAGYASHNDNAEEYADLIGMLRGRRLALLQYPEEMMRLVCPIIGAPDEVLAWVYGSNLPRQFRLWGIWGMKPNFRAVRQKPRNPEVSKVRTETVASYDWWEQPQVKNTSAEKEAHPCQIPASNVERVARLLEVESFIDPFLGSGTSGVAALSIGIPFIGIEKDPTYFDIACRRIEDAQRQGDFFIESAA